MNLTPVLFHKVNKRRIRKAGLCFLSFVEVVMDVLELPSRGTVDGVKCSY